MLYGKQILFHSFLQLWASCVSIVHIVSRTALGCLADVMASARGVRSQSGRRIEASCRCSLTAASKKSEAVPAH
jgi:hypothetical protein